MTCAEKKVSFQVTDAWRRVVKTSMGNHTNLPSQAMPYFYVGLRLTCGFTRYAKATEAKKVERVVPNALRWVHCHRLAAASRSTSKFSCVPAFPISATSIVQAAWSLPCRPAV